ncbi:MAG: hypothetical protein WCG92_15845, partial [Hyphomicrobiales bacterium]
IDSAGANRLPIKYSRTESARNFNERAEVLEESFGIHRGHEKRHGAAICGSRAAHRLLWKNC